MGRGSRDQAATARGLLFGPRRSGSGPVVASETSDISSASGSPLDDRLLGALSSAVAQFGVVKDVDQAEAILKSGNAFIVEELGEKRGTAIIGCPETNEGLVGVSIIYFDGPYEGIDGRERIIDAGSASIESQYDLEKVLRQPLSDAGFDYTEMSMNGQEALKRLDGGEEIDFACPGDGDNDLDSRRKDAQKLLDGFSDIGYVQGVENMQHLRDLVRANQDGQLFSALAEDRIGRQALARSSYLRMRTLI